MEFTKKAIHDAIAAEETYVENLRLIVTKFLEPLKAMSMKGDVPPDCIPVVFGNLPAIASFHEILLVELKKQQQRSDSDAEAFAKTFNSFADCCNSTIIC